MHWALIASLLVHVGLLVAGVVTLPSPQELETTDIEASPIEVDVLSDVSERVAQSTTAKEDVEKPAPEEVKKEAPAFKPLPEPVQEQTAALPPIEEEVEIPPLPEPPKEVEKEPEPEPLPKEEPKKEEVKVEKPKVAAPIPRTKPKKRLPKKKKKKQPKFDIAAIEQALLDKSADKAALQKKFEEIGNPQKANVNTTGTGAKLSATELDWLRQHIEKCWLVLAGANISGESLLVTVDFDLDRDGYLIGAPRPSRRSNKPLLVAAIDNAVRAVHECQPYDKLSQANYEAWKTIRYNFDPKKMLGG